MDIFRKYKLFFIGFSIVFLVFFVFFLVDNCRESRNKTIELTTDKFLDAMKDELK